ncbi:NADH-quinone oxidoreductase subunit N [Microbulbifer sp. SA54]|uniref:NADH-quinone oxidoreductase subunit N n=1 Tax=Microbulbifer sp. SA54 TaxID=3401577 RepID=UPI003AAA9C49
MSIQNISAIAPLMILSGGIVALMLQVAFFRSHRGALATTLCTLGVAAASCIYLLHKLPETGHAVTGLLLVDRFSLFLCLLNLFIAVIVSALGLHYLNARLASGSLNVSAGDSYPEEFYILLLLAVLGGCTLVSASHFASFFLALELISISFYPLLAFSVHGDQSPERDKVLSLESGLKYLMTSALATALGLFGIALVFSASGSLAMFSVPSHDHLYQAGIVLFFVAIAFKLSLVPFHFWTPDVYQGAPTPVTALLATLGKGALIAILFKIVHKQQLLELPAIYSFIAVMAAASMIIGNLLALRQQNLKRLLAYSSIAHLGYLFVALLLTDSGFGSESVSTYLVAYVVTTLSAFSVVSLVADSAFSHTPGGSRPLQDPSRDPFQRMYYRGLLWRAPALALCFGIALLSLAGIPLTLGFIGKFYLFSAGVQGQNWWLLSALILGSALGLYYYLGLILDLLQRPGPAEADDTGEQSADFTINAAAFPPAEYRKASATGHPADIEKTGWLIVLLLTFLLLGLGIYPSPLINWINAL